MSLQSGGDNGTLSPTQNLIDVEMFQKLLDLETQKALRLRYSISVLCVSVSETPQGESPPLTRYVAEAMIRRLRATDVATVLSPSVVGILLVDAEIQSIRQVFDRATETLRNRSVRLDQGESRPTLRAGAVSFPGTVTNASDLMRQAIALMGRASREGTVSVYLPD
ncbi:MAG: hypothetical protein ACRDKX_10095 [Solirubrobacterales bacterium]